MVDTLIQSPFNISLLVIYLSTVETLICHTEINVNGSTI